MEDVSTRVLEKIKNIYEGKTEKWSGVSILKYTNGMQPTAHYVKWHKC